LIVVSILYVIRGCIEEHETIEQFRLVSDEKVLCDSHFYDPASTTPFMLVRLATITGTFNQRLWDCSVKPHMKQLTQVWLIMN